jgi:phosphatidate phosphatase APP1
MGRFAVCAGWMLVMAVATTFASSQIRSDERVVFFPTAAHLSPDGQSWRVPVHGWIFEPEEGDYSRTLLVNQLCDLMDLQPQDIASARFRQRVWPFLVDSESGKRIVVKIAESTFAMPRSGGDGHFMGTVQIPLAQVRAHAKQGRLTVEAQVPEEDNRVFRGHSLLLPRDGISVISDIDDTVKITEVTNREQLLRNTLLRPFRDVSGMSERYRAWDARGWAFHYVSNSPWQLYGALAEFLEARGFPPASFHLRRLPSVDLGSINLLEVPFEPKRARIEQLFRAFPQRRFILVGDSGERDPEIYGGIARDHPGRIVRILIRQVTDEAREATRYQQAFRGVEPERWQLFRAGGEIAPFELNDTVQPSRR